MTSEIKISAELQAYIDPLSVEEYAQLEASIIAEGCRDPLVVCNGYLLDGHNRYAICAAHGIKYQTFEKSGLDTMTDIKIWMIENQMGRRNLTDYARTVLALRLKPLLAKQAEMRKVATHFVDGVTVRPNSDAPKGRTDEGVAKMAGVGRDTVRKVELIEEKAAPEVKAQVRAGEISINAAAKTVMPPKAEKAPEPEVAQVVDISEVEALRGQLAEQIERNEELAGYLKSTMSDNEMMTRVFDSDDKLAAALAEVARYKAAAENAKQSADAKQGEYIARAKAVTMWQNKAIKFEKELAGLRGAK